MPGDERDADPGFILRPVDNQFLVGLSVDELTVRAGVTLFDDVLQRVFTERLATHLPTRVLPVSVDPPRDLAPAARRTTGTDRHIGRDILAVPANHRTARRR